jgi:hypothetical protein
MTAPDEHTNRPPPQPRETTNPFGEEPGRGAAGSPRDWTSADWTAPHPADSRCLELCPICRGAEVLRAAGGTELRGQLDDVGREALLTLRSLVDHYLERLDARPEATERVERIPID